MTDIEPLMRPVLEEARLLGMLTERQNALGCLTATDQATLESTRQLLAQNSATLLATIKVETASEIAEQSQAAMAYITALVVKAGGVVELSGDELAAVDEYQLERAEPDGGLALRAFKPSEEPKIETPPQRDIILPEGLH